MRKTILNFFGFGFIACAVAATVVLVTPIAKAIEAETKDQGIMDLFQRGTSQKHIGASSEPTISNADLEESISGCAELTTAEYEFSSACQYENDGVLWFTGEECTFTYSGTVNAGISDLSKAEVRIDHKHQMIMVYMPDVEILGIPVIDPSSIRAVDERTGWFSDITVDEYSDLLEGCCDHAIDRAQENDILTQAEDNARTIVENTISAVIAHTEISNYNIDVRFGVAAPAEHEQQIDAIEPDSYKAY